MGTLFFSILILIASAAHVCHSKPVYQWNFRRNGAEQEYWITQRVSHFDPEITATFQQRYFKFEKFATSDSTINFLYICGEANCPGTPNNYVIQYAKQLNARIYTLEHRYYGKSFPVKDLSTRNLRWLTSQEALADLAVFVQFINNAQQQSQSNNKWVVFGCSYAGALSAWFRLKYPHLVIGAVSSSGVIDAVFNFVQFDEQVRESVGHACAERLVQITRQLVIAYQQDPIAVKRMFKAPDDMLEGDFFFLMADAAAESVQYGFQLGMCESLLAGTDLLSTYANFTNNFFYPTFDPDAPVHYSTKYMQETAIGPDRNGRQFWYQMCSELGYFQNAPHQNSIRADSVNMSYHKNLCALLFAPYLQFPPNTNFTNLAYGGVRNPASRIIFGNGSQDPWKRCSKIYQGDVFPEQYLLIATCSNCGHCVDLRGCPSLPSATNGEQCTRMDHVESTRAQTLVILKSWLQ